VQQLDRLYPRLARAQWQPPAAIVSAPVQDLDFASVTKASQAVSSEIVLPKLIERLMRIAIENAGAERGLLILPSAAEHLIQAEARATGAVVEVAMREQPITGAACPESIVRYVIRTQESVILDDASKPNMFSGDPYLGYRGSKSILCLPLIKQRRLAGILLLENALTSHAFTPARIAVLEVLAAQAAISLENAHLYRDRENARAEIARMARVMALSAMSASIAHEVNQPLTGILSNARVCLYMLEADPPDLDGARLTANRTIRDANRASEVLSRLRAMFAQKQPAMEPVDLNDTVSEVVALSTSELQQARVVVRTEFCREMPAVLGDRIQLQQVVLNLVLNAADAMQEVHDRPRELLLTTALQDGNEIVVSVSDSGMGFGVHEPAKLFEAFHTTKAKGMGIGLTISRSIVESHGGRIWAMANDGAGATFSFSIPCSSLPIPSSNR
jgi:signal transduction histidine kinase